MRVLPQSLIYSKYVLSKVSLRYLCDKCEFTSTERIHLSMHKESKHEGVSIQ